MRFGLNHSFSIFIKFDEHSGVLKRIIAIYQCINTNPCPTNDCGVGPSFSQHNDLTDGTVATEPTYGRVIVCRRYGVVCNLIWLP